MDCSQTQGRGRRRLPVLLLAILWTSSALADEKALFYANREWLAEIAIAAAHEEFPDIAPDDLIFEKSLYLWCNLADEEARLAPAVAEALSPCIAELFLTRVSTRTEIRYRDPQLGCMEARRLESIGVKIHQDRSASVGARGWQTGGGTANDCGEELDQLPLCWENPLWNPESCTQDKGLVGMRVNFLRINRAGLRSLIITPFLAPLNGSADEALFFVDVEKILQISIDAVYEAYPELPADDLLLERTMSVVCNPPEMYEKHGAQAPEPLPCFTQADFVLRSTLHEGHHLDEWGECMPGTIGEKVIVQLNQDGSLHDLDRGGWVEAGDYVLRECPPPESGR